MPEEHVLYDGMPFLRIISDADGVQGVQKLGMKKASSMGFSCEWNIFSHHLIRDTERLQIPARPGPSIKRQPTWCDLPFWTSIIHLFDDSTPAIGKSALFAIGIFTPDAIVAL